MNRSVYPSVKTDPSSRLERQPHSLRESLEPRVAVEKQFARLGHTHRHGKLYRQFENRVIRPLLRSFLKSTGLYPRGVRNALSPVVTNIRVSLPNLPSELDGFQILHLSDFHVDGTPALVDAMAPLLRTLRPDVCLLTGDYRFDDRGPCDSVYPLMRSILSNVQARLGIFGILGNHDHSEMALELEVMGVRMLVNESVELGAYQTPLWLLGVDDPFDYRCHDLARALQPVPSHSFRILMAHAPELFEEAAASGVHLYLCGHTHAGQIRFPILGSVRSNAQCPRAYTYGPWRHREMHGFTSPGVGCSSLPVRFGCPPELVMIELASER